MQRCTRCIMDDSSDPTIRFDENGVCNYCTDALHRVGINFFPGDGGKERLDAMLTKLKAEGKGKQYDCMMGISGGLDSSYLAYLGHQWGLRVLCVHIDDGFDTEISKGNIQKLIAATGFHMITIHPDAEQFYGLTKAYMRAGVSNLDTPQDNVLFAELYRYMRENNLRYFLSGANFALEGILQRGNLFSPYDVTNIRDINRRFGSGPIDKLPLLSFRQMLRGNERMHLETLCPLDLVDYNRDRAFQELADFCGFAYYGRKHLENILTAFIQTYWFPKKFGVDKRTSHLSSMIVSGQMTREEALKELAEPLYDETQMAEYLTVIQEKLRISPEEFAEIMAAPAHAAADYRTSFYQHKLYPAYWKCRNGIRAWGRRNILNPLGIRKKEG